jgi:hypothetical protein
MANTVRVNPELSSLIPPLSADEYAQLEANILQDGCRDPLIVWAEEQTLLDGHHRRTICEQHGRPYTCQDISLPDLDAAKAWMITNQLGRRNLTPEQMSYYRGEQYNLQKRQGKRTDVTSDQSEQKLQTTAERLADQHHISAPTIRRDGAYADGIEVLAQVLGPEVRQAILAGEIPLTRQDIRTLSLLLASDLENQTVAKAAQRDGVLAPTLQAMARAGRCAICHRPLSDPGSISRGIGPVCAGHGNGAHGTSRGASQPSAAPLAIEDEAPVLVLEPELPEGDDAPAALPVTGDDEWYTPLDILALVKAVLGAIDVDPATDAFGQALVQATTFYTKDDDGLRQSWYGRVFCNPPYRDADVGPFSRKLWGEITAGHTSEAILLVNATMETKAFQAIARHAAVVFCPEGRLPFIHKIKHGHDPLQGQAILYFGPHVSRFCEVFGARPGLLMQVMPTPQAQLDLATPPAEPVPEAPPEEPAPLIRERDYCIVHLPPSRKGSADFDPCSIRGCPQVAHYRFWTHQPRPTGPVWTCHYTLCPAHAAQWCLAHQVDIQAIPTITFAEWHAAATAPGGDYGRLPWFRFAAHGTTAKRTVATKAPRAGTLIMRTWEMVKQLQPCTNAQVAQALKIRRNQAFEALKTLVKQGKVRKDGQQYVATTV